MKYFRNLIETVVTSPKKTKSKEENVSKLDYLLSTNSNICSNWKKFVRRKSSMCNGVCGGNDTLVIHRQMGHAHPLKPNDTLNRKLPLPNTPTQPHTTIYKTIQRTSVRETGVSRYHRGQIEGPPETPRTSQYNGIQGLREALNRAPQLWM